MKTSHVANRPPKQGGFFFAWERRVEPFYGPGHAVVSWRLRQVNADGRCHQMGVCCDTGRLSRREIAADVRRIRRLLSEACHG